MGTVAFSVSLYLCGESLFFNGLWPMTCRELVEFLAEYLSGTLPPDQHAAFDTHLESCPECVAYLKSYQETVKLGKEAFRRPDAAVPDAVPDELVRAILAARRK